MFRDHAGIVYFVGAGPGDPGLITLRGVECLARADLVLHDYLANEALLDHAPPSAERLCLGRHGAGRLVGVEEICRRMVEAAGQGRVVVRLKSGDPMVFARMTEEMQAVEAAELPYEIVPGVTAAIACAAFAGASLTNREDASAAALVTGRESDKGDSSLDFGTLARFPGSIVVYMGVTTARQWTAQLVAQGMAPDAPVALIRRCSFPDQRCWYTTLGAAADLIEAERIRPPVAAVVGPAGRRPPRPSWFSRRPLFGRTALVARPEGQAAELARPLAELGARVLRQEAIRIGPPASWDAVDQAIGRSPEFEWIVFSSSNGVRSFFERLNALGKDARALGGARIAAIGPGTSAALEAMRLRADLVPAKYRAESLAATLAPEAAGKRCLLVRASRGREVLAESLAAAGALVEQVVAYQSEDVESPDPSVTEAFAAQDIDYVAVTSSAIARSLVRLFGEALRGARLASISPITTGVLTELGFPPATEAERYDMPGVVAAIRRDAALLRGEDAPLQEKEAD